MPALPDYSGTLCVFLFACVLFTLLGLPLARCVAPAGLPPLAMAPMLGWAVFSVVALKVLSITGFDAWHVTALAGAGLLCAGVACLWRRPRTPHIRLPTWAPPLAFCAALLPAIAIMPKWTKDGILLAPPMFDHVKIAVVDSILRSALPVVNPFYGPAPNAPLAYYYLWHFSAAMAASLWHCGGWAAEAAMTGFTGFASLSLMMGLAIAAGGGRGSVLAVAALSLPGTMRPLLAALSPDAASTLIPPGAELNGWLNQAAWVPQHLSAGACVVLAVLIMSKLAVRAPIRSSAATALVLGFVVAAGFESSVWVGGIAFAAVGAAVGGMLLLRQEHPARGRFLACCALGALVTAGCIAPFVWAQLHAVQTRALAAPMALRPYGILGPAIAAPWRSVLDVPAFWLIALPYSLPAIVPACVAYMLCTLRRGHRCASNLPLALTSATCLLVAAFVRSTIDNNDLGWRAILPAVMIVTAAAGVFFEMLWQARRLRLLAVFSLFVCAGLADAGRMVGDYSAGWKPGDPAGFGPAQKMWRAVAHVSRPNERVANNPAALARATPWPVNIGWATLSDRASCYAGYETVIAYGALPAAQLHRVDARFARVFDGTVVPGDLAALDGCDLVVLVPQDGAWRHDPFARESGYRLVDATPDWRIYRHDQK